MSDNYQEKLSKFSKEKEKFKELYNNRNKYKDKSNAFNVFNILNLRENSHTSLINWLLENNEKFRQEFFELINLKINESKIFNEKKTFTDEETNKKYHMDCIFSIKKENNNYIFVIESKLDATLCIRQNRTQIERYCNYIYKNQKYENYEKYFIYLCPDCGKLNKINKNISIGDKKGLNLTTFDVIEEMKTNYKNKINFCKIEFSDIILILFKILYKNKSKNRIFYDNGVVKDIIEKFDNEKSRINKDFIKKVENKHKYSKEELKDNGYTKPQRYNIDLYNKLNEIKQEDEIKQILSQYIEYWEDWAPFIDGYTKIIDGIYLYDIMKNL